MDPLQPGPDEDPQLEAAREQTRAAAFGRLFDAHFDAIRCFLYRYVGSAEDARDLVHETFLRLWQRRRALDFTADLRPYLYGIARRAALDALRHRRVVERYLVDTGGGVETADDPEDALEQRELAAAIQQAIDTLSPQQRQVITLRWQRQLSYEEIGRELGLSPKTVDNHVSRAFAHLRVQLSALRDR